MCSMGTSSLSCISVIAHWFSLAWSGAAVQNLLDIRHLVSIQPWFKMVSKSRAKTTADNSSTGRKSAKRHKTKQPVVCLICDENIVDATSHTSGQATIFCDGLCKEWLHCQCARLSKAAFTAASQSQDAFFCPQCHLATQSRELLSLKATIATLNEELLAVKNKLSNSLSPSTTALPSSSTTFNQSNYEAAPEVPSNIPLQFQYTWQQGTHSQVQYSCQPDKKFSIVIYVIEECPKGSPKHERFNRDLEHIMSVISWVDTDGTIQPQSIRDHFCLGKFKNSSQSSSVNQGSNSSDLPMCPAFSPRDNHYNNHSLLNLTCPQKSILTTLPWWKKGGL